VVVGEGNRRLNVEVNAVWVGTESNLCTELHFAGSRTVCFRAARAYVRPIVRVLDGMGPCRAGPVHCSSPILSALDPVTPLFKPG
jgi:hypothetical protein